MQFNFLKISYRTIFNAGTFSVINVVGLTIGIASFLLLVEYIAFEQSFNKNHKNFADLYRMVTIPKEGDAFYGTPPGYARQIQEQQGMVRSYCRTAAGIGNGIISLSTDNQIKSFREDNIVYADGSFFDLFSADILEGNPQDLKKQNRIALSLSARQKYFGREPATGKIVTVNNQFGKTDYVVSCVFKDFPINSDIQYSLILSLETLGTEANLNGNSWVNIDGLDNQFLSTWLLLEPSADIDALERDINLLKAKLKPSDENKFALQEMQYVHLPQSLSDKNPTFGNLHFIYLLGGVALVIIIIAWFNYINLSTAHALRRAKEVGVRKTIGASKGQLVFQFLGESLVLNILSCLLAFALVGLLQAPFNMLVGRDLSITFLFHEYFLLKAILCIVAGSFLSGGYVAFVLSSFKPAQVLKGNFARSSKGILVRKGLVVFQFSISVILLSATVILYAQLQFVKKKNTGMDLANLLVVRGPELGKDSTYRFRSAAFQNSLRQLPFVEQISVSGSVPGRYYNFSTVGITKQNPLPGDEKLVYAISVIDENYLDAYGIMINAGRKFTSEECSQRWNSVTKVMVNEKAARQLGFDSPADAIGQKVIWGNEFEVVGVVKDYNHTGFKNPIDAIVFYPQHNDNYLTIKTTTLPTAEYLSAVQNEFAKSFQGNPFEYFYAKDNFEKEFSNEKQYGMIFTAATSLAIVITIIGLLGLATFMVLQRTKEISIRKVFGASRLQLSSLITNDFLLQISIGSLIGIPIAWWGCQQWLEQFAYRTELTIWIFFVTSLVPVFIALITISLRSVIAASSNPVEYLRRD